MKNLIVLWLQDWISPIGLYWSYDHLCMARYEVKTSTVMKILNSHVALQGPMKEELNIKGISAIDT